MKSVVSIRDGELLDVITVAFSGNILLPWIQIKLRTG